MLQSMSEGTAKENAQPSSCWIFLFQEEMSELWRSCGAAGGPCDSDPKMTPFIAVNALKMAEASRTLQAEANRATASAQLKRGYPSNPHPARGAEAGRLGVGNPCLGHLGPYTPKDCQEDPLWPRLKHTK